MLKEYRICYSIFYINTKNYDELKQSNIHAITRDVQADPEREKGSRKSLLENLVYDVLTWT